MRGRFLGSCVCLFASIFILRLFPSGPPWPGLRWLATLAQLRFCELGPLEGLRRPPCTCTGLASLCTRACGPMCPGFAHRLSVAGWSSSDVLPSAVSPACFAFVGSWSPFHTRTTLAWPGFAHPQQTCLSAWLQWRNTGSAGVSLSKLLFG